MASRRVRIKGIANIPARRKNDAPNTSDIKAEGQEVTTTAESATDNKPIESPTVADVSENSASPKCDEQISLASDTLNESNDTNENINQVPIINNNEAEPPKPEIRPSRRWTAKPAVRIPSVARQPKPPVELEAPKLPEPQHPTTETNQCADSDMNIIINETITKTTTEVISMDEPPLKTPQSPSKMNRVRIRPVPKFIRRNSVQGSASESEDDGRKVRNRIRNDSVCSTSSITVEISHTKEVTCTKAGIQYNTIIQRKCRRSEQSRKMAEARRDFVLKFGSQTPDKKKLTMMDLIFYNPTTNPMTKREIQKPEPPKKVDVPEEEEIDDPPSEEEAPVPQVKVGPDGEIILDEQSLVIEQTGAKKGREQLANSQLILDDLNTSYGVYKRVKRSKDWTTTDTLKFYRALHTVGTDFSLMQSLFPERQRRELKLKFKKEERINRQLIDKALLNPLEFNLTELKTRLERENPPPASKAQSKKREGFNRSKKFSCEMIEERHYKKPRVKRPKKSVIIDDYSSLEKGIEGILTDSDEDINDTVSEPVKRSIRLANKKVVRFVDDLKDSDDESKDLEVWDKVDDAEHVTEIENNYTVSEDMLVPDDVTDVLDEITEESTEKSICVQSVIPQRLPNVDPGSLMILSSVAPTGEPIYKVFMVAPDKMPMDLNTEQITLDYPAINEGVAPIQAENSMITS